MSSPADGTGLVVRGPLYWFRASEPCTPVHEADGAVFCRDGRIVHTGPWPAVRDRLPDGVPVHHYPDALILPGFVDCHTHYPQTGIVGRPGADLTEWIERHGYPEEARFGDPAHCAAVAERFCAELLRNGTTTALTFCTSHPGSVDALFTAATARNLRMVAGKVLMDRGAPAELLDTAERGYRESAALLHRWHGHGRNHYAIIPRFALSSTPAQLDAAGALWREHPDALLHTHIAETRDEVAEAARLFPDRGDYLGIYERFGLTGPGAVLAHGVQLTDAEFRRCHESGTALAHCPASNLFLGSGLFDLAAAERVDRPVPIGLGTDIGAGPSFSLLATIRAAHDVARLRHRPFDPVRAFHRATLGGARVLRLADRIGSLDPGHDADLTVLDPAATPLLAERTGRSENVTDLLFALAMLGDDRAVRATYVAGVMSHGRASPSPADVRQGRRPPR